MTKNNEELNIIKQEGQEGYVAHQIKQEGEHVAHTPTLYAEPIAHIGSFTITNALFTSWIVVFVMIVISIVIRSSLKQVPKGFQNLFEFIIEGAEKLADQVTGDRKITNKAFPIVFTVFL